MCGICGFTGAHDNEGDRATLKAMCDVMAHRGPDGEGRLIAGGVALGHRRLALIDLEGGAQPMARGRWSIVFNGEIYNYRELRAELEAQGHEFETNSDTEVLLVGYIAWSEAVLQRVRGMFAFAIHDAETHELFCARDFFGIKPFYYTTRNGRFIFASEIKSILEHPAYERRLNEDALAQYLCFQFNPLHETFFEGVYKLQPGHCLRVRADASVETGRYWRAEFLPDDRRPETATVDAIDRAMRESVRYHNVADVEVGSFLSSGIDSSYLAACLAQENPAIKTFTVGFAEYGANVTRGHPSRYGNGRGALALHSRGAERDEVSWARELAATLGVENDGKLISEEEYWQALPLVQWHMDEPTADPSAVALFFVDQLAARRVKAVLSGEGADEFFGGYRIYQAPLANGRVGKVPKPLLRIGSKMLRAAGTRGANYLERASGQVEDWYYTNANGVAFTPGERRRILAPDLLERLERKRHPGGARRAIGLGARRADGTSGADGGDAIGLMEPRQLTAPVYAEAAAARLDEPTRMQYVDLWFWLVGDILLKTDKMAMAHSLESRVPFLDREVFRLAGSIPAGQKLSEQQTKLTLRQAAERAIPRDWAQKEKLGFPVPVAGWLREDRHYGQVKAAFTSAEAMRFFQVGELLRLLDEHRSGAADNTRRIWIAYSFLVWYRVFFVERRKPE